MYVCVCVCVCVCVHHAPPPPTSHRENGELLRGCSGVLWAALERYAPRVLAAPAPAAAGATAPFNFPRISNTIPFNFLQNSKRCPLMSSGIPLDFKGDSLQFPLRLLWAAPGLLWNALGCSGEVCSWSVDCSCSC